jgi:hypothetical protein
LAHRQIEAARRKVDERRLQGVRNSAPRAFQQGRQVVDVARERIPEACEVDGRIADDTVEQEFEIETGQLRPGQGSTQQGL